MQVKAHACTSSHQTLHSKEEPAYPPDFKALVQSYRVQGNIPLRQVTQLSPSAMNRG